ncbi:MAG: hypothetical protein FD152_533 [Xanthobacteraceae bacterium]|nr:MAG: hypothetical protein FD152_533 [Xanthobacteraceae bacterium]
MRITSKPSSAATDEWEWHPHFAILPVSVNGQTVWLEWVERRVWRQNGLIGEYEKDYAYRTPEEGISGTPEARKVIREKLAEILIVAAFMAAISAPGLLIACMYASPHGGSF